MKKYLIVSIFIFLILFLWMDFENKSEPENIDNLNVSVNTQSEVNIDHVNETQVLEDEKIDLRYVSNTIPVLMYHYVRVVDRNTDPIGYNLSIDPEVLEMQLEWLIENNINTVHISEILPTRKAPENSVVLLFDDGYKDFYENAYPIFKRYGLTASVAVITEKIDAEGYLSEQEINDLLRDDFEIVSHTHTHKELPFLSNDDLVFELSRSKAILSEKFDIDTSILVYPVGKYNQSVIDIAANYYDVAFTTEYGVSDLTRDLLKLPRIRIDNRDGFKGFVSKLESFL